MTDQLPQDYDHARFDSEWAADQDVLARLAEQGDRANQVRAIDVSFRGNYDDLSKAQLYAVASGFEPLDLVKLGEGEYRLDVSRQQAATPEGIRELTILALKIEAACGVIYDGWGCVTQNDKA